MKRLCLFRHAKSSWGAIGTEDIDRPLAPKGETNAPIMGNYLKEQGVNPDLLLTSNAKRAVATAELICEPMGYDKEKISVDEQLYEATVEDLVHIIQALDNKVESVVLIAHNPALTLLANYLADEHVNNLPTCGVFCMEFATDDWNEITTAESKVLFSDEPSKH